MINIKPIRKTCTFHPILAEFGDSRWRSEHYKNFSDLIQGYLLFDMMTNGRHQITNRVMQEPEYVRDRIIEEAWLDYKEGRVRNNTWLAGRLHELNAIKKADDEARKNSKDRP